jgi:2-phosphosulfolactate phosphatase
MPVMEQHLDDPTAGYWDQAGYDARFEWGEEGVRRLARSVDVVVIVDVLSFSTCIDVAVGQGASVLPIRWRDERAEAFARRHRAHLAVHRQHVTPERPFSLSPSTLRGLVTGDRLVLPSPNGAALSVIAAREQATILTGCLRNATAVARRARELGRTLAVIAAGERWPGDPALLRPSSEDLVGAGAILAASTPKRPSPEAVVAMAAFDAVSGDLPGFLRRCSSGRELIEMGYPDDVKIAGERDASATAPIFHAGAYMASRAG